MTPDPIMIEKVARAMAQASGRDPDGITAPARGSIGSRKLWELYVPQATAALEATHYAELTEAYEAALLVCHSAIDECRDDKLVMVDGERLKKLNDALTVVEEADDEATPTAPVQDDDAEWLRKLANGRVPLDLQRLERIANRLSPTPETDQRNPIEEADGYRDSVPEDDADALSLARGEITWLREAIRRFEAATITVEQQAALTVRAPSEGHDTLSGAALGDVAAERQRQIDVEGWTPKHDDGHNGGALAKAAACYATGYRETFFIVPDGRSIDDNVGRRVAAWPWHRDWWKPGNDRRRQLVIAGALIVAEIERLDRASVGLNPEGRDRETGLGRNDEHAVGEAETPNPSSTPETGLIEAARAVIDSCEERVTGVSGVALNMLIAALANTSPAQPIKHLCGYCHVEYDTFEEAAACAWRRHGERHPLPELDRLSDDGDVTE